MSQSYPVLQPYGWSSELHHHLPAGTQPARIIRHDGSTLLGVTSPGTRTLRSSPQLDPAATVGDWVAVADEAVDAAGHDDPLQIVAVLPRRSLLRRRSPDGNGEQALAANVDRVLITCGVDRPIRAGRIQRVAAQAWDSGASPVLVLTKAADPSAYDLPRLELDHPGIEVVATAALEGVGVDALRTLIAGRTSVLVGESGAGKSTLANALLGREVAAIGDVRSGDAKGRHTTTARQLHLLPGVAGGSIIDTPGLRSVGLAADAEAVDAVFPEIEELSADCRFADCQHDTEPGCEVQAAVVDGRLPAGRLDGWRRLQREVASAALRATPHEYRAEARRFGKVAKQALAQKRR